MINYKSGEIMRFFFYLFLTIVFVYPLKSNAQVIGLSDWNIFIDPGHSQSENMGIYNYPEAHKVLRVGLNLRQLLLDNTDIDTVYMSRTNDQQQVSLSQRTDYANNIGAAWFHSIHSDAGGSTANSTLLMYGGWRQNGQTIEKIPNGGKEMSNYMVDILTRGMRITTRGNYADRTFYQGFPDNHTNQYPYLHVNRESNMASELSEAGFHTNPTQNQRNMNAEWKRLEAYTLYWSILEYFEIERPFVGITTGIISNIESGLPVNGAVVSLNGQNYTTDTYESLFHLYSNDPEQLRNGFYFFENLPPGTHTITAAAEGFDPYSDEVTIVDTFFTFKDIQLVSNVAPFVVETSVEENDSLYPGVENIGIIFSRPMDKASVESGISISPSESVNFIWSNGDRQLAITTANFDFNTNYMLTISGNATDKYDHPFDGDGDGSGGDDYILNFKTKVEDMIAPSILYFYPSDGESEVELTPVINFSFSERINTSTLSGKIKMVKDSDQSIISGILKHYIVNDRSIVNLFVVNELETNENYTVVLEPGVKDIFGNEITDQFSSAFTTSNVVAAFVSTIDNFEAGIGNWWQPQQSGSTIGYIAEFTSASSVSNIFNYIYGGSKSMLLSYGFDTFADNWLIREHYPVAVPSPSFNNTNILQTYLFGDGTENKFRFAVRDNTNSIEVSPWYTIDWIGWKLLSWDMENDGTGSWIGNGILENPLRIDSYQLTYEAGNLNTGALYFDDLVIVDKTTVGIDDENFLATPADYSLEQNYPNPFNPTTQLRFGIPEPGFVKLEVYNLLGQKITTLVNEEMNSGYHSIDFNTSALGGLSSGIYVYTLSVNDFVSSKKMILLK
jgi:N-acetylmuramoyl-L-alanine amidase